MRSGRWAFAGCAALVACAASPTPPAPPKPKLPRVLSCPSPPPEELFLVGDDASTRGPVQAGTPVRFARYDGATLTMLPECKSELHAPFGAYACRSFMDAYDGAFEIDDTRVVCEKYPLASAMIGPHVADGVTMKVRVGVSAVCTNTHATIHRNEIAGIEGCRGATHFVYAYDLGALQVALGDAVVPSEARGNLSACNETSLRQQLPCRVPVHASLRLIQEGGPPPPTPDPPEPPPTAAPTASSPPDAGVPIGGEAHEACVIALNTKRKELGLRYLLRDFRNESCADTQAAKIAARATTGVGGCGAKAHNVCVGRGSPTEVAVGCADEIIHEGASGARYQNMTNTRFPLVYCGVAKLADGRVQVVQYFGDP